MVAVLLLSWLAAARLSYVVGVGWMLRREDREQYLVTRYGVEEGYNRFRRIARLLMVHDSVAFIALCVFTANTFDLPLIRGWEIALGLTVGIAGIAVKVWATRTLGGKAYYWYNFFDRDQPLMREPRGPYRVFSNPMYGIGYAQTYGLALVCASWPGLVASVFMQASIMVFNEVVEAPHFAALIGERQGAGGVQTAPTGAEEVRIEPVVR